MNVLQGFFLLYISHQEKVLAIKLEQDLSGSNPCMRRHAVQDNGMSSFNLTLTRRPKQSSYVTCPRLGINVCVGLWNLIWHQPFSADHFNSGNDVLSTRLEPFNLAQAFWRLLLFTVFPRIPWVIFLWWWCLYHASGTCDEHVTDNTLLGTITSYNPIQPTHPMIETLGLVKLILSVLFCCCSSANPSLLECTSKFENCDAISILNPSFPFQNDPRTNRLVSARADAEATLTYTLNFERQYLFIFFSQAHFFLIYTKVRSVTTLSCGNRVTIRTLNIG